MNIYLTSATTKNVPKKISENPGSKIFCCLHSNRTMLLKNCFIGININFHLQKEDQHFSVTPFPKIVGNILQEDISQYKDNIDDLAEKFLLLENEVPPGPTVSVKIFTRGTYWRFKYLRVVSSRVNKVTDHLTALKEDAFVAVHIEGYNKVPMLRKVKSLDTSTFKLEYWRETWRTEWKP
ncbi:hypothetical protein P5673_003540 [Acropora cervicornis]|uniref:Uncharacterized protein n=1 Tax=Acropora cervicornis TaxID=6130 RepID=A0AAD9R0R4_ACRCE|nr:hypothetical protein P5673_003540 [Acropora cervicornis]